MKTPRTATAPAELTIALCGNPNSGKTTLFNLLTGSNQKVGNWPGVTVEQKSGRWKKRPSVAIADTPGIYSLSPFADDEKIALRYLSEDAPDVIINVVDCTNLERNLFLTTQLLELQIPVVVALNMADEADKLGIVTDAAKLEQIFRCKFFAVSAAKNRGIDELMNYCTQLTRSAHSYGTKTTQHKASINTRAVRLIHDNGESKTTEAKTTAPDKFASAKARYDRISAAVRQAQTKTANKMRQGAQTVTQKIDKFVLNKWLAFPIFALVMTTVFFAVDFFGGFVTDLINQRFTPWLQNQISGWFKNVDAELLRSLFVDGIVGGVMSVVGFLPQIMLLFGFIAVLESSGYMSRIAFITDRLLCRLGLGGRSFVSMILGCGCSVPAIMATRTIKNPKERNATVTLTPFMPCSAKLAVIAFFTAYVFGGRAIVSVSFYFLSILAVITGGMMLKLLGKGKRDASDAFIMELPSYRKPTAANVTKQMWERGKSFLIKAGTIIFAASVVLWIFTNFNIKMQQTDAENSLLASLGKLIAPIFYPLGWNDLGCGWQFAIATLSGFAAKETVVTTLEILLPQGAGNCISALGAYSFVAYNLLTVPCVSAVSASFAEQGRKGGFKSAAFQVCIAYTISLIIYQTGTIAQRHASTFVMALCCLGIAAALIPSVKYALRKRKCNGCAGCQSGNRCKTHE